MNPFLGQREGFCSWLFPQLLRCPEQTPLLPEASVSLLVPLVFTDAAVRRDRGTVTDAAVGTEGQRARARARGSCPRCWGSSRGP